MRAAKACGAGTDFPCKRIWFSGRVMVLLMVVTLMKNTVKVVRVFREELEEVGGFFPLQIVEENGKVVRRERRSEHIVK